MAELFWAVPLQAVEEGEYVSVLLPKEKLDMH